MWYQIPHALQQTILLDEGEYKDVQRFSFLHHALGAVNMEVDWPK